MRIFLLLLFAFPLIMAGDDCLAEEMCLKCHNEKANGLAEGHRFTTRPCSTCHDGNSNAARLPDAHLGLVAFPGNLNNASQTCGTCHPTQVASVSASPMHTGTHMVQVTRRVFGQTMSTSNNPTLQSLSETPADSLLRKLCASCHLGQEKTRHGHDVTHDQGGGCLACHLNNYTPGAHPTLSLKVEDSRCFGCHSRSSRIALSYAGLAETNQISREKSHIKLSRLADGRLVEHRPADAHHQVGMSCIDCHTGAGLMGELPDSNRQEQSVDITCSDCHSNQNPRVNLASWPKQHRGMLDRIPFPASTEQEFLTTGNGTPLWHIEIRDDELILHQKVAGNQRIIPKYQPQDHLLQTEHKRLTCNACHAQWAPQCYECHLSYSPDDSQWDHTEQRPTPGRWSQRQAGVRNGLAPLGVTANGDITTFVPGMIMSVDHPDFSAPLFRRVFGSLSPHTTGAARTCETCHQSTVAMGLGEGRLENHAGDWAFRPTHQPLQDGLPADAWTTLEAESPGDGTYPNDRSFNREEIMRILNKWTDVIPSD